MVKGKARKRAGRKRPKSPVRSVRRRKLAAPRAIETALAGIAHDVRTPLTGIVALAELLASSNLGQREREWARAIKSGADHLAALTTLIVDAAKADAAGLILRNEPFSLRGLAQAVGEGLTARAKNKGIEAKVDIVAHLPALVAGDAVRLRAALENLADNAVKFTHAGTVSFMASAEAAEEGKLRLVFTLTDSGIGMSARELRRLFKPFAQASAEIARRYGGAGLGLSFVKRVAKTMGGDLHITSKKGVGSAFRLTALVGRVEGPLSAETDAARTPSARALTLLCAEDNPYGRVVMNTILSELGHRVDFVESGETAVMAAERGGYDAILMDIALTGMDGIAATRIIRTLPGKFGQVPVIGISGHTESRNEIAARAAGMNFYFTKPVSPGRLAQTLAEISKMGA
jgi:CheY-like chemotaxis protein